MFEDALLKYASGEYNGWFYDKNGRLAAIILCDQMSRNIYRKTAKAFAFDSKAVKITKAILNSSNTDENLSSYKFGEHMWILTPLMHSENGTDTRLAIINFNLVDKLMESD